MRLRFHEIFCRRNFFVALVFTLAVLSAADAFAESRKLLVISIDGLRPDYVTKAGEHKLRIPFLRELMRTGVHASGVRGILPTSTYPSHTAIMTGVSPSRHGIPLNNPFDPAFANPNSWFWYAEDIRVPTLWDAVAGAGGITASISWPVTVGAKIQFNIPEYNQTKSMDDLKMLRAVSTPGLLADLEKKAGPYVLNLNAALERDQTRARYAVELIRSRKIDFFTVHLTATDHLQHDDGPFTPAVFDAIEKADKLVGEMTVAFQSRDANAAVCIVSDHGFAKVDKQLNLYGAFVKAGLIKLKSPCESIKTSGVADWIAMPWSAGGSAAVVLKNRTDSAARQKVKEVLDQLAGDSANGIAEILDKEAIAKTGGTSEVDFWVDLRPGFSIGTSVDGPAVVSVSSRGVHGYSPTHAEMNSFFLLAGKGIKQGADVGQIDMRSIAPTLAKVMNVSFPTAELPPLDVFEGPPKK